MHPNRLFDYTGQSRVMLLQSFVRSVGMFCWLFCAKNNGLLVLFFFFWRSGQQSQFLNDFKFGNPWNRRSSSDNCLWGDQLYLSWLLHYLPLWKALPRQQHQLDRNWPNREARLFSLKESIVAGKPHKFLCSRNIMRSQNPLNKLDSRREIQQWASWSILICSPTVIWMISQFICSSLPIVGNNQTVLKRD